jgi:predicted peroxiredoxin
MPDNGKVIVGCTHGDEEPDRVCVSYLTSGTALDKGKAIVMWLSSEGVRLALRGYVDRIREDQEPPAKPVHNQFIEKGGRFYVCRSASTTASATRTNTSTAPSSREPRP